MQEGCIISFQDYAFELSGKIIIAVNYLIENKYIAPTHTAASSLFCKLIRPTNLEILDKINAFIANEDRKLFDYLSDYSESLISNDLFNKFRSIEKISIVVALSEVIAKCKVGQNKKLSLIQKNLSFVDVLTQSDGHLKSMSQLKTARMICSQYRTTKLN